MFLYTKWEKISHRKNTAPWGSIRRNTVVGYKWATLYWRKYGRLAVFANWGCERKAAREGRKQTVAAELLVGGELEHAVDEGAVGLVGVGGQHGRRLRRHVPFRGDVLC